MVDPDLQRTNGKLDIIRCLRSGDRLRKRSRTCRSWTGQGRAGVTGDVLGSARRVQTLFQMHGVGGRESGTGGDTPTASFSAPRVNLRSTLKSSDCRRSGSGSWSWRQRWPLARPPRGMLRCLTIRNQENMTSPGRAWISSRGRGTLLIRNRSDEETVRTVLERK
jgi:hypothetical protein